MPSGGSRVHQGAFAGQLGTCGQLRTWMGKKSPAAVNVTIAVYLCLAVLPTTCTSAPLRSQVLLASGEKYKGVWSALNISCRTIL